MQPDATITEAAILLLFSMKDAFQCAFSALTLLVRWQEEPLAHKNCVMSAGMVINLE